ncbi:MAG: transcriptional repressor [Bacteroidetes bacterium]|nr:transcriptional repressor [Bacteroidota bacterium]MBS1933388.1 transcriptional repressor [Bacteroidota bacterium]
MNAQIEDILKRNQLSVTSGRVKILELFLGSAGALSHGDIEKKAGERFDRVTVYRTLQVFLEKGIIHNIPTSDNSIRYALCKDNCHAGHHHDNHIHFVCNDCGNTICLENVTIPPVKLPKGFTSTQVDVVVSGICKECK